MIMMISMISRQGAQSSLSSRADQESVEDSAPEVAIAEDFKRLLAALPPEKRKLIGQELMGLIDGDEVERLGDVAVSIEARARCYRV